MLLIIKNKTNQYFFPFSKNNDNNKLFIGPRMTHVVQEKNSLTPCLYGHCPVSLINLFYLLL